ncbi:uncharacterized protein LOC107272177 [Cephus cinctus]|uniref:Uncharacterized protein LOC107272177 n=1 Tax=Cephus cinctus TaxID=211228 RepID=A0AAJ7RQG8_CEPCN|nr:uncharacterized protein LOC107272177 [Cephus cinctus]
MFDSSFEATFVHISFNSKSLVIAAAYIPPGYTSDYVTDFLDNINCTLSNYIDLLSLIDIVLLGDFNLPGFKWSSVQNVSQATGSHLNVNIREAAVILNRFCNFHKLAQVNDYINIYGNTLDLAFTNIENVDVDECFDTIFDCDVAHKCVVFTVKMACISKLRFTDYICDFKRANFIEINKCLNDCSLIDEIDNCLDVEEVVDKLNVSISLLVDKFIPKFIIKSSNYPKWFSSELIRSIKCKKELHKLYKEYKSEYYYKLFCIERTKCKNLNRIDYKKYMSKVENAVIDDSSYFFSYVNSIRKNCEFPSTVFYHDVKADTGQDVVNLFAKKFGSVYTDLDLSSTDINYEFSDSFYEIIFNETEVLEAINSVDVKSGPGPDLIHPLLLTSCPVFFTRLLTALFNRSLASGCFPRQWKTSFITPLHKGGNRADVNNYRPIAKPSVIAKIFDKLVHHRLQSYLVIYIMPDQHGFISGRSATTNLSVYLDYLVENIMNGHIIDAVYTDFVRAFDMVNISLLVRKLAAYGISGVLLNWLRSFLSDRIQRVKVKNYISDPIFVTSGVGQGTLFRSVVVYTIYK